MSHGKRMAEQKPEMTSEERYRKAFGLFDINKNGRIEAREIQAIAFYLGYRLKEELIYRIIRRFDSRECGEISYEDFLSALRGPGEVKTEEEKRQELFHQKFDEYIREPGGHVSYTDACHVLRRELGCADAYTSDIMRQFDVQDGADLSYEDFVLFYSHVLDKKEDINKSFREFDREDKGYVSFEDAQRLLSEYGFSDEDLTAMFNVHDRNRDNKLHYDEFLTFWGVL